MGKNTRGGRGSGKEGEGETGKRCAGGKTPEKLRTTAIRLDARELRKFPLPPYGRTVDSCVYWKCSTPIFRTANQRGDWEAAKKLAAGERGARACADRSRKSDFPANEKRTHELLSDSPPVSFPIRADKPPSRSNVIFRVIRRPTHAMIYENSRRPSSL